jgi:signal peptidase II
MTTTPARHRWMDTGILLAVASLVFAADRLTKAWIVANVDVGAQINVLGDFLQIWHTENAGAAFGLLQGGGILFVVIGVVTLGVIGWVHLTGRIPGAVPALLMGLVLGGTLGNLTDRLAGGTVTDFVSVGIGDFRWATFNVADAAVVTGILGLVIVLSVLDRRAAARTA